MEVTTEVYDGGDHSVIEHGSIASRPMLLSKIQMLSGCSYRALMYSY